MDSHPENAQRRELVIVLYAQEKSYAEITEASGFTTRGVAKILERAREAGDERAAVRRVTTAHRHTLKAKTVRWVSDRGQMPGRLLVDLGSDVGVGGVATDWDEGMRW